MSNNNTMEIIIPNQGLTLTEVVIVKWYKKIGETVQKDETLLKQIWNCHLLQMEY